MRICIGIVSYLPEESAARQMRIDRINRLFKQLETYWRTLPIIVIAQNWGDFNPIETNNHKKIIKCEPLGIIGARKKLESVFLNDTKYDYIMLFDDDCIIESKNDAHLEYINRIKENPYGFAFLKTSTPDSEYCPYASSQLNLCALSRSIVEKEPLPYIDASKNEGYEDRIYSTLLHGKYSGLEFDIPEGLKHTHFKNPNESAPSTWATDKLDYDTMNWTTKEIEKYIHDYKELPDIQEIIQHAPKKRTIIEPDGNKRLSTLAARKMLEDVVLKEGGTKGWRY